MLNIHGINGGYAPIAPGPIDMSRGRGSIVQPFKRARRSASSSPTLSVSTNTSPTLSPLSNQSPSESPRNVFVLTNC